jgi:uncharacterized MAPEG superfamily protein
MHISYWMVLVAAFLPILTVGTAKAQKSYDNASPRAYLAQLQGWRARAHAAHQNHFEAFPVFAAAIIIAQLKHEPQSRIDLLAIGFILLRIAYTLAYTANIAPLRSLLFIAAFACNVALIVLN